MSCLKHILAAVALIAVFGAFDHAGRARTIAGPLTAVCERVAEEAALRSGVPVSVLKAISLTETGRKTAQGVQSWPWTVNMEGAGHWFDTRAEARAFVETEIRRGAKSFDIGCFQINHRWHGNAFASIDHMFDPLANALYAARFLSELYAETGNWTRAAGAFHSRTQELASKYAARFDTLRQRYLAEDTGQMPRGNGPDAGGAVRVPVAQSHMGAPLNAMAKLTPPVPTDTTIPDIPDIVAMLSPPEPERVPRVNRYPLLQKQTALAGTAGSVVATRPDPPDVDGSIIGPPIGANNHSPRLDRVTVRRQNKYHRQIRGRITHAHRVRWPHHF